MFSSHGSITPSGRPGSSRWCPITIMEALCQTHIGVVGDHWGQCHRDRDIPPSSSDCWCLMFSSDGSITSSGRSRSIRQQSVMSDDDHAGTVLLLPLAGWTNSRMQIGEFISCGHTTEVYKSPFRSSCCRNLAPSRWRGKVIVRTEQYVWALGPSSRVLPDHAHNLIASLHDDAAGWRRGYELISPGSAELVAGGTILRVFQLFHSMLYAVDWVAMRDLHPSATLRRRSHASLQGQAWWNGDRPAGRGRAGTWWWAGKSLTLVGSAWSHDMVMRHYWRRYWNDSFEPIRLVLRTSYQCLLVERWSEGLPPPLCKPWPFPPQLFSVSPTIGQQFCDRSILHVTARLRQG